MCKACLRKACLRGEHGLMEASEKQKAEFAECLDSVRRAAENADAVEPAAEPMDMDAQQGLEQQGDELQGA